MMLRDQPSDGIKFNTWTNGLLPIVRSPLRSPFNWIGPDAGGWGAGMLWWLLATMSSAPRSSLHAGGIDPETLIFVVTGVIHGLDAGGEEAEWLHMARNNMACV
jgi:hypothetical protein